MNTTTVSGAVRLPIALGTEILIELTDFNLKVKGELVGMDPGRCLIIKFSTRSTPVPQQSLKDCRLLIKYLYGGTVYEFTSTISNTVSSTAKLVFVNFPERVGEHKVRLSPRYACVLPATASIEGREYPALVDDISSGGCHCVLKDDSASTETVLREATETGKKACIRAKLPGSEALLCLSGPVRNYSKRNTKPSFGMMFEGLDAAAKKRLEELLATLSEIE